MINTVFAPSINLVQISNSNIYFILSSFKSNEERLYMHSLSSLCTTYIIYKCQSMFFNLFQIVSVLPSSHVPVYTNANTSEPVLIVDQITDRICM